MRLISTLFLLLSAGGAYAAKDYQVTGPVVEVTPSKIVVKKGKDNWVIQRDASTKVEGNPSVGSKVTVYYSMIATEVDTRKK